MSEIKTFSMKTDSDKKLSEHFTVREFACHDGSDTVKIDMQLIRQLETIRAHFGGKPIHINSAYRTPEHNAKVGGSKTSYHMKGMAADIVVQGVDSRTVAQYAESLGINGIGWYEAKKFTHLDNRSRRVRWKDSGSNVVKTFGSPSPSPTAKYTNSPLVGYTRLVPKHSGQRTHCIDRITPHCVVGQVTAARLGDIFSGTREVSSNYGIALDGTVGLYVEEKNRSWCSSSKANDQRAITIECASDSKPPYAFKPVVYETLIKLCIDICKRNGKKKLLWFGDKAKTLNYSPKPDEMVLTVHRWFANKSCPGDWLYSRMSDLAKKVTDALNSVVVTETPKPASTTANKCPYKEPTKAVKPGSTGNDVKWVQWHLNKCGAKLKVDGSFGYLTKSAVTQFQKKNKLTVDAIVGPKTRAKLKQVIK